MSLWNALIIVSAYRDDGDVLNVVVIIRSTFGTFCDLTSIASEAVSWTYGYKQP